jgi:hypothetical protein
MITKSSFKCVLLIIKKECLVADVSEDPIIQSQVVKLISVSMNSEGSRDFDISTAHVYKNIINSTFHEHGKYTSLSLSLSV